MSTSSPSPASSPFIRWFADITLADLPEVGGKNASLGEMYGHLTQHGIRIPNGFALTAGAYRRFLNLGGLEQRIRSRLRGLDTRDVQALQRAGQEIRNAILETPFPAHIEEAILEAHDQLQRPLSSELRVAVRSSATTEDLPEASFAGQQETFLNVPGGTALIDACRRCFASLFLDRAISYRVDHGFDPCGVALSVGIQHMVRSDLATSGVAFTLDTETGFRDVVLINAAYGLGENVVQGSITPDECLVFKPTLKTGFRPVLRKRIGSKEYKLVYDSTSDHRVKNVAVPPKERQRFCLSEAEILQLARWACRIEEHYSALKGSPVPMDIEWAKDGLTGDLFILQARPETVQARRAPDQIEIHRLLRRGTPLVVGRSIGDRIATGKVRVIPSVSAMQDFQQGEILVTDKTDPDWEPIMKRAAAIVTNRGGRTCHAAIVSRELGVPAIVGTETGTRVLKTGQSVTVCCAEGDSGFVYDGILPFEVTRTHLSTVARPRTRILINAGNPEEALALSFLPCDGIGLAREEFIISNSIRIHPLALVHFDALPPGPVRDQIASLTEGYEDKSEFFVDRLAEGIAMLAAAFHPREVILRLSDFKTNEYANLIGGRDFEPFEENPMLGFRGASRYAHPRYRAGFALECQAVRRVRDDMGLTHLKVMIPFCRTLTEARQVQEEMARHGLIRGENGLEIYVMCEIPSNVILAEEFADLFDGFSIGSNDLTQLILGVDRDSEIVAPIFDERNAAVKRMIAQVIAVCRRRHRKIGICGQAPSDYPEFARFLVEQGIDSISLNPDTVLKTLPLILETEQRAQKELALSPGLEPDLTRIPARVPSRPAPGLVPTRSPDA